MNHFVTLDDPRDVPASPTPDADPRETRDEVRRSASDDISPSLEQAHSTCPRQSMSDLPAWMQPFLTWMTGKPLPDQQPWFAIGPVLYVTWTLLQFATGVALSAIGMLFPSHAGLLLIPAGWMLTIAAARTMTDTLLHQAAHNQLFPRHPRWNNAIGDLCSIGAIARALCKYRPEHVVHHSRLAETVDQDIRFLLSLGFVPGRSIAWYWCRMVLQLISPSFHGRAICQRLNANLTSGGWCRRVVFVLTWSMAVVVAIGSAAPATFVVALLFPLTVGVQAVNLIYVLTEHRWVRIRYVGESCRVMLCRMTSGRFLGAAYPNRSSDGWWKWLRWWLCVPLWISQRIVIWAADTVAHDDHHRHPLSTNWTLAIYERRDHAATIGAHDPPYTEIWGVCNAINATFASFAAFPAGSKLGDAVVIDQQENEEVSA
ncbi:MAG: hypothetical protein AAFV88_17830 [Planctomycetota bacterium]